MTLTPCEHSLVVDEPSEQAFRDAGFGIENAASLRRRCLLCGFHYHRTGVLTKLRDRIRERYRVTSPWTSAERAEDC